MPRRLNFAIIAAGTPGTAAGISSNTDVDASRCVTTAGSSRDRTTASEPGGVTTAYSADNSTTVTSEPPECSGERCTTTLFADTLAAATPMTSRRPFDHHVGTTTTSGSVCSPAAAVNTFRHSSDTS